MANIETMIARRLLKRRFYDVVQGDPSLRQRKASMGDAEIEIIAYSDSEWKTPRFLLQVSFRDGAPTTVAFAAGRRSCPCDLDLT
jgi:hypothetical protein